MISIKRISKLFINHSRKNIEILKATMHNDELSKLILFLDLKKFQAFKYLKFYLL